MEPTYKFHAFISYSHRDTIVLKNLPAGLLDVLIPLEYQQPSRYAVKVLHNGIERKIAWQSDLEPQLGRTEVYEIVLRFF